MALGVAVVLAGACEAAAVEELGLIDRQRQSDLTVLVRQDCGSCHGMTLKGGLGKPLLPDALHHLDADSIAAIILDGVPGQPMPPWRGLLSEADARWIGARLKEGFPE